MNYYIMRDKEGKISAIREANFSSIISNIFAMSFFFSLIGVVVALDYYGYEHFLIDALAVFLIFLKAVSYLKNKERISVEQIIVELKECE